jgi:polyisoprenoid-binding protein YceI
MQTTPGLTKATPQLGRYQIDPGGGSSVTFRSRHLFGLAPVHGRFAIRAGTVDVSEPLADSRIYAEIDVASFHTGNPLRDAQVRSARFLAADEYPVLAFSSQGLDGQVLAGTLTVREATRPVSVLIEVTDVSPRSFTARATVRIDRYDFGVTASRGLAGRYLDVTVEVRCVRN